MQVRVVLSGPVFDGRAQQAVDDFLDAAKSEVAAQASAEVHLILDQSIRNPTPYYETQITVERMQNDRVVHDRGIVYGPWLEGVSYRNQITSFKGYHAFRDATRRMQQKASPLVAVVLHRFLPRMR